MVAVGDLGIAEREKIVILAQSRGWIEAAEQKARANGCPDPVVGLVATAAAIRPDWWDGVFVFPYEWDIATIESGSDNGWRYLDLRHLEAPRKLRHAAVLADGRVLLPAMLCFKTEQGAHEAIHHYQRPMAEERFRGTLLVEVELLRIRMEPNSDADCLVVERVEIVEATVAGRVKADYVTSAGDEPDGPPSPSMNSHSPR